MLDDKQVNAVAARIELDLRIGYALTRFLSNNLKTLGGPLANLVISYGKCESDPSSRGRNLTKQDLASFPRWDLWLIDTSE